MDDRNILNKNQISKEPNNDEKADIIIEKWKNLQNIILEEKSLFDVLFNYKNDDYKEIKKLINNYLESKLELRQIKNKNKKINNKEIKIDIKINNFDNSNINLSQKINNFLFFLRNNIDYIVKIIFSIDENDNYKIESLVELICNQLYDELPLKNNKHKHLMIIIYKLLEKDICNMDYAIVDNFLNSNIFLEKLLFSFCQKEEFSKYLNKILNPLLSSIEKEIENSDILNLSLFEIKDYINSKNNPDKNANTENKNKINDNIIDNKELIKNIWKNFDEFVDDLTQEKLYNMIKEEKNINNKELYKLQFERSFYNKDISNNIFSNDKFLELLNKDYFNQNIELIINKYKQNYLFIHQKIDIFLLELINDIKLIPNNIRYICKIIYVLISKKFPNLPKYLKNSFIGKFFFEQYVFNGLIMENKLIFENKIISFETKKCIGEIISILSHANKCLLFNNDIDTEKTMYNKYLMQIIPILDRFYNGLINIKLPNVIDRLLNLKLKEIEMINNNKKKFKRKRNAEDIIRMNNYNNLSIQQIIHENRKNKNKNNELLADKSLWKLEFICYSINDLLYILSLIDKNQNTFINLPKCETFYNIYQSLIPKISSLEPFTEQKENIQKFYIAFNTPSNKLFEMLNNHKNKKFQKFRQNPANNISDITLNNIEYSIKMMLQELEIINKNRYNLLNMAFTNKNFLKYLYYSSLEIIEYDIKQKYENKKIPIYLYGHYIIDNIKNLDKKYSENDCQELYNKIYNEELYNLNQLKKFWDIIITRNDEKIKIANKTINKLKLNLEHILNSITINKTEQIIFHTKLEVYVRVDVINKSEDSPPIIIDDIQNESKKNDEEALINNIEEFINIFSENSLICDPKLKIKPYDLLILDIIDGKNDNKINDSIITYLSIIKNKIKVIYPEIKEKDKNYIMDQVKDYILKSIYKLVFPKASLKEDKEFYKKTQLLDWVTPEHFSIKNIDFAQLTFAESLIKKFEDSKSIDEKINCICDLQKYINNIFKFNTGKNVEIGQDELTPVLQYLIIKIQPRRIISNINYIKCFLNEEDSISHKGFLMSQIDTCVSFVQSINYNHLNVSEAEYNKNVEKSKKKNNIY